MAQGSSGNNHECSFWEVHMKKEEVNGQKRRVVTTRRHLPEAEMVDEHRAAGFDPVYGGFDYGQPFSSPGQVAFTGCFQRRTILHD